MKSQLGKKFGSNKLEFRHYVCLSARYDPLLNQDFLIWLIFRICRDFIGDFSAWGLTISQRRALLSPFLLLLNSLK